MENKNRKTFFMFLMAFLVAFLIVSFVEVLKSSFLPSGAPEIQTASAVSTDVMPGSFSDLAERVKPAVVNISTTKIFKGRGGSISPFDLSPFGSPFGDDFLSVSLVIYHSANLNKEALDLVLLLVVTATFLPTIMLWNRQTKFW